MPRAEYLVTQTDGAGRRLDVFLSRKLRGLTRSQIQKIIARGEVRVGGIPGKSGYKLRTGDPIVIDYEGPAPEELEAEDIPLSIIYEDAHVVILDKPSGLVVHPGAGNRKGTLAAALLHHYPEVAGTGPLERPGIVHRLDKETSGVMVAAKNLVAYEALQRQFRGRDIGKVYLGLVWGRIPGPEGRIDRPIGRHVSRGERVSVRTRKPREAVTNYRILRRYVDASYLEIRPLTGRTHQIRVHLAAAGHPVVGDRLYGRKKAGRICPRLFLHAHELSFKHPKTGERVEFTSPLPGDLEDVLRLFEPLQ